MAPLQMILPIENSDFHSYSILGLTVAHQANSATKKRQLNAIERGPHAVVSDCDSSLAPTLHCSLAAHVERLAAQAFPRDLDVAYPQPNYRCITTTTCLGHANFPKSPY